MNVHSQAQRAYSAAEAPTRTGKSVEYEAVARITHRLHSAAEEGQPGFARLAEALHDNRKLWCIFATEVADPGNPLPADLKARLFYLAEFTLHHSARILAGEAGIAPLLEINASVMRGLRGGAA